MKTALYTTLYKQALPFWEDFFDSVLNQTDKDFDLVLCLDGIQQAEVSIPLSFKNSIFFTPQSKMIASVRQECWQVLCNQYDAIIMVDADDVLKPKRVENAKNGLKNADIDVCGLQLVDKNLKNMPYVLEPKGEEAVAKYIIQCNDIGLSNTAYRTSLLEKLMPFPNDLKILDWFLAIRAVEQNAMFNKRADLDMLYRQYDGNIANFIPPYTIEYVERQTDRVITFWDTTIPYLGGFKEKAQKRLKEVIASKTMINDAYISRLHESQENLKWWHMVAKQ